MPAKANSGLQVRDFLRTDRLSGRTSVEQQIVSTDVQRGGKITEHLQAQLRVSGFNMTHVRGRYINFFCQLFLGKPLCFPIVPDSLAYSIQTEQM